MIFVLIGCFTQATASAVGGGKNVAVIDDEAGSPSYGELLCQLMSDNGHMCTLFPKEGPTTSLEGFDVVADYSGYWTDPDGVLADFLRSGKTVITLGPALDGLGIANNSDVRAWIGADLYTNGDNELVTVHVDAILGGTPVGTEIFNCGLAQCAALQSTTYHSEAKVLARYHDYNEGNQGPIGILRNYWDGGVSIYLTGYFSDAILLNAVNATAPPIPAVSSVGICILIVGLGVSGLILVGRRVGRERRAKSSKLLWVSPFVLSCLPQDTWASDPVTASHSGGVTELLSEHGRLIHSTPLEVTDLRSVAIPDSQGAVVLWNESWGSDPVFSYFAISLDGTSFEELSQAAFQVALRAGPIDPDAESPVVPPSLEADDANELWLVQFVCQPLPEFRAAVIGEGARPKSTLTA